MATRGWVLGWVQVVTSRNLTGPVDELDVVAAECRTIHDSDALYFVLGPYPVMLRNHSCVAWRTIWDDMNQTQIRLSVRKWHYLLYYLSSPSRLSREKTEPMEGPQPGLSQLSSDYVFPRLCTGHMALILWVS